MTPPKMLTIAGSDSGGGAGIQADLRTAAAHGCYGLSVIVALTAQNTRGVTAVAPVAPDFIRAQMDAVLSDIGCDAAKTGMLANAEIVEEVARAVRRYGVYNLVVDPVMVSKSNHRLIAPEAEAALRDRLLPVARLITPNAQEAAALLNRPVRTVEHAHHAAVDLGALTGTAVLVKGGHLEESDDSVDHLWDGRDVHVMAAPRLDARHTHGTGCTLSAAIACNLARGQSLLEAVEHARAYLRGAMKNAYSVGSGISPVNHLWRLA